MEFFNEFTNLAFPSGIFEDLITGELKFKSQLEQNSSFSYVKRIELDTFSGSIPVIFQVEQAYFYHLEKIRVSYPKLAGPVDAPDLRIDIGQGERGRNITPNVIPLPMSLISTPGQEQVLRVAQKVNVTYTPNSYISFRFTNFSTVAGGLLFVMTEGLRLPKGNYKG